MLKQRQSLRRDNGKRLRMLMEVSFCGLELLVSSSCFQVRICNSNFLLTHTAFGVGTMIWTGLEIGTFFETPLNSPCLQILKGVNPLLQMIFTFLQMYFIFMNSRVILNIHRFKVVARFGLMHVVATNVCVWIRTLVMETLKEITNHYHNQTTPEQNVFLEQLRLNVKENEGLILGDEQQTLPPDTEWEPVQLQRSLNLQEVGMGNLLQKIVQTTAGVFETTTREALTTTTTTTTTTTPAPTTARTTTAMLNNFFNFMTTSTTPSTTLGTEPTTQETTVASTLSSTLKSTAAATTEFLREFVEDGEPFMNYRKNATNNLDTTFESLESLFPEPLFALSTVHTNATKCEKDRIMGSIVKDSSPYLYPFIIEYSLIGAVVLYVMWKHIGRYQK